MTDIAKSAGSEQGITNRMDYGIRVRVAYEPSIERATRSRLMPAAQ